ncbi:MAG: glycosyltransferase [Acidobacteria bacterium]|nr:MAG: glycosyltransferase [Acidobacteriota bacterium]
MSAGGDSGDRLAVLHLIDTLEPGGSERVAVDLVNHLPRSRYAPFLGTTRRDGQLARAVAADVGRLRLRRRGRFDPRAVVQLARFLRRRRIRLIHAHATTVFIAALAACAAPRAVLLWHDHFGRGDLERRSAPLYRLPLHRAAGVIAVGEGLAAWAREALHVAADRVWYLPNFVADAGGVTPAPDLPGIAGQRLVCVANFRPQKDHQTLVRAMAEVARRHPRSHLLLVGAGGAGSTRPQVEAAIAEHGLSGRITILGRRDDVASILAACDLGVLASASEGLPLALLEYGRAGLAAVATRVGQCPEVLAGGDAGRLVPPGDAAALADALSALLDDPPTRRALGRRLAARIAERYAAGAAVRRLESIYRTVLTAPRRRR